MFQFIIGAILLCYTVSWVLRKLKIGDYGNRYVFITGCDTGFGNMLAKRLDVLGFHVFAGCLTETGLDEVRTSCSDRLVPVALDVTSDACIEEALIKVKRHLPAGKGLWAVVNNAGIVGSLGPLTWQSRQDYLDCLQVNLFGVIFVTKAFLPLVAMEKGRVVNTSSIAGRFSLYPVYSVTKYGVESFSDSLRYEMYRQDVSVHIIEPGHFATPILNSARLRTAMQKKLDSLPPKIQESISQDQRDAYLMAAAGMADRACKSTYMVVDAYTHAISAKFPKHRYLVGNEATFKYRLLWTLPEWISDYIFVNFVQ